MIIYTSGTTGDPKGTVHTHSSVVAQIESLVEAWEWHQDDRILNCLHLHHVHGAVNVVNCALYSGASLEMHNKFDTAAVWHSLLREENHPNRLSLFMAVPTIYYNLIKHLDDGKIEGLD